MVTTPNYDLDIDTTLGGNNASDYVIPSQKAIKSYVDNSTGGNVMWGNIAGTLSNQTDLQNALDSKYDASNPNGYTSNKGTVTSVNNVSPINGNVTLSIPTVNNATLTIQKNGTTVNTFTANASSNVTANITVPTATSDLTNDSGFITSSALPTKLSDLTNDSGFITNSALSGYATENYVDTGLATKQATLVSGANIKTINGNSLLGSGNIEIQSGTSVDTAQLSYYGTCSTGASTQAKVVVCEGFVLKTGASIRVKFDNAQTYNGQPTLNVNSTGAKSITLSGTTAGIRYMWQAGDVVEFTYDGTNWIWERGNVATTTYYGMTKLTTSAVSGNTSTALTPNSLNGFSKYLVVGADAYSASDTYAVGDRVRYSWYTWECTTAISTPEAWDETHWRALEPIQIQLDDINAMIGDVETLINAL